VRKIPFALFNTFKLFCPLPNWRAESSIDNKKNSSVLHGLFKLTSESNILMSADVLFDVTLLHVEFIISPTIEVIYANSQFFEFNMSSKRV
jgi:hypothetical protein